MNENIDRSVWINYFNEFSRRNQSRPTHLQIFGELGAQEQARGLPFEGIALNSSFSVAPTIEIMLSGRGRRKSQHLTHVIPDVQKITPKRGLDGRDEALEIISGDGYRNLLLFEQEACMSAAAH